jgi:Tol biopolymer transport system component
MRFPVSGGSPEQVLEARTDELADFDCSGQPAGTCIFDRWKGRELIFYALDPVRGLGKVVARTKLGRPTNLSVSVSPSGSRIALCSWDQLRDQVRILDLATSTERDLAVPRGWYIWSLSWTAEGDALFAAVQSTTGYLIIRIGLEGEIVVLLDRGRNNWLGHPYSSPDGRRLAFTQMTWENNVWLLENF